jgi:hypothetical protein
LSRNKQQRHLVPKNCPKTFSRGGDVWPWRGVIVVHYQVFLFFSTLSLFLPTAQYFSLFLLVIVSSALEFLFIYMPVHGISIGLHAYYVFLVQLLVCSCQKWG